MSTRVNVGLHDGADWRRVADVLVEDGADWVRPPRFDDDVLVATIPGVELADVIDRVRSLAEVDYVEADVIQSTY